MFGRGSAQLAAVAAVLSLSLAACGGSDEPEPAETPVVAVPSSAVTPDQAALDQGAVTDLVSRYWKRQMAAQNAGDDSTGQFANVAKGGFIEKTLKSIRTAKADGVVREGSPELTEVEVAVTGDTAEIKACLDEDDWIFVRGAKDLKFTKYGTKPWGAEATRTGETWLISDVRLPPKDEKNCT